MVDVHAGDHGAVGVDDVGGVQPPAQADLQNGHIQAAWLYEPQDGQSGELEVGQRHLGPSVRARSTASKCGSSAAAATLSPRTRQRPRNAPDAAMNTPRCGSRPPWPRPPAGRRWSPAVGAGDGDHRAVKAQRQPARHLAHAGQAHVDILGMQPLAMLEPALQCLGIGLHRARDCRRAGHGR